MSFSVIDIMNQKARQAWELYLRMETSSDSFSILQLIANDCYKVIQCLNVSLSKQQGAIAMRRCSNTVIYDVMWSCFRWDSFIMQLKLLMLWRDWIRTRSTGRGNGEHVWESSSSFWPVESPGVKWYQVILVVIRWEYYGCKVYFRWTLLNEWPLGLYLLLFLQRNA